MIFQTQHRSLAAAPSLSVSVPRGSISMSHEDRSTPSGSQTQVRSCHFSNPVHDKSFYFFCEIYGVFSTLSFVTMFSWLSGVCTIWPPLSACGGSSSGGFFFRSEASRFAGQLHFRGGCDCFFVEIHFFYHVLSNNLYKVIILCLGLDAYVMSFLSLTAVSSGRFFCRRSPPPRAWSRRGPHLLGLRQTTWYLISCLLQGGPTRSSSRPPVIY